MTNARFADYATSGAFNVSLSRHQVAAIGLMAQGAAGGLSAAALERKGLAVALPLPIRWGPGEGERVEYRLTSAGLICAELLAEAGLTNGRPDPRAAELEHLQAQLTQARRAAREADLRTQSALARKDAAERELAEARAELSQRGPRLKIWADDPYDAVLTLRDPLPEKSDADLMREATAPAPEAG